GRRARQESGAQRGGRTRHRIVSRRGRRRFREWSCEPSGGRGGSAMRAARRVWERGRASRAAAAEARRCAPRGESGNVVVRAERRPRRLGGARREASLGTWSCEPSGGRGGSAMRAARRVWERGVAVTGCCSHEGKSAGDARFEIKKVADGVHVAVAAPAYKVNSNTAIIESDDGVTIVDTHSKPSAARVIV